MLHTCGLRVLAGSGFGRATQGNQRTDHLANILESSSFKLTAQEYLSFTSECQAIGKKGFSPDNVVHITPVSARSRRSLS